MTTPHAIEPDPALADRLFPGLREACLDPPGGTRGTHGAGVEQAHAICIEAARRCGLDVSRDFAGNTCVTLPGTDRGARTRLIGSHLDSVRHGGNFDGTAGVIAGLAALAGLRAAGVQPRADVAVMMTRAEETVWFPVSLPGSKAALGRLPAEAPDLRRSDTGLSPAAHMAELGFDPDAIRAGRRHLDPARLAGFVEAHIEQGPELLEADRAVAIVPSISGGYRFRNAVIRGACAHVGSAPKRRRRDAVATLAHIIAAPNAARDRLDAAGHRIMATFGVIGVDPEWATWSREPGEARFTLDIRSVDLPALQTMRARLDALTAEAEATCHVSVSPGADTSPQPGFLNDALLDRLRTAARAQHRGARDAVRRRTRRAFLPRHRRASGDAVHPQPERQRRPRRVDGTRRLRRGRADLHDPGCHA